MRLFDSLVIIVTISSSRDGLTLQDHPL